MLRVALTGGIASGKSHVLEQFRARGVPVLDADRLAHGLMTAGTEATTAIAARFGDVLTPDGAVDRAKLGAIVFADEQARRDLEAIVHPGVYRAIAVGLRAFERLGDAPLAIVDVPLLYETGHASEFDRVIVTAASADVQLQRLLARGLSENDAKLRMAAQEAPETKAARADFVIRTDRDVRETDRQVDEILQALLRGERRQRE
jgi:dephospho-CoA kinase